MRTGRPKKPLVLARRARVVLACAEGLRNHAVAKKLRGLVPRGGRHLRAIGEAANLRAENKPEKLAQ